MLIHTVFLRPVRNLEHYDVMKETLELLYEVDTEALHLNKAVNLFKKSVEEYGVCLGRSNKSNFTEEIRKWDERRLAKLRLINHLENIYHHSWEEKRALASNRMGYVSTHFGEIIYSMSYQAKTQFIEKLIAFFDSDDGHCIVEAFFLESWIEELREDNRYFAQLMLKRDQEQDVIGISTGKARQNCQDQFEYVCDAINSYAFAFDEVPYLELANGINNAVARAKEVWKRRRSMEKNKKNVSRNIDKKQV